MRWWPWNFKFPAKIPFLRITILVTICIKLPPHHENHLFHATMALKLEKIVQEINVLSSDFTIFQMLKSTFLEILQIEIRGLGTYAKMLLGLKILVHAWWNVLAKLFKNCHIFQTKNSSSFLFVFHLMLLYFPPSSRYVDIEFWRVLLEHFIKHKPLTSVQFFFPKNIDFSIWENWYDFPIFHFFGDFDSLCFLQEVIKSNFTKNRILLVRVHHRKMTLCNEC